MLQQLIALILRRVDVDQVVSSFHKLVARLEAIEARSRLKVDELQKQAERLKDEQERALIESTKARSIATKLKDLVS